MDQVNIIISFLGLNYSIILIVRVGIRTNIRTSSSAYRSLSNKFDLENSAFLATATKQYTDYLSNRGYRIKNFAKRGKSRKIELTSSNERIDGKRISFSIKNLVLNNS